MTLIAPVVIRSTDQAVRCSHARFVVSFGPLFPLLVRLFRWSVALLPGPLPGSLYSQSVAPLTGSSFPSVHCSLAGFVFSFGPLLSSRVRLLLSVHCSLSGFVFSFGPMFPCLGSYFHVVRCSLAGAPCRVRLYSRSNVPLPGSSFQVVRCSLAGFAFQTVGCPLT